MLAINILALKSASYEDSYLLDQKASPMHSICTIFVFFPQVQLSEGSEQIMLYC